MSRTEAAGKVRWVKGVKTRVTDGKVSRAMMDEWVRQRAKVELRGAGTDESPHCYKRLTEVLAAHSDTLRVIHTLTPVGVAMAGENDVDPYKD
jgi:tRNA-splicing ligase RtcB